MFLHEFLDGVGFQVMALSCVHVHEEGVCGAIYTRICLKVQAIGQLRGGAYCGIPLQPNSKFTSNVLKWLLQTIFYVSVWTGL